MPLYGRAFLGTDGPGRPYTGGVGPGSWENGTWDYKALPPVGSQMVVDDEAVAGYSYDATTRTMISFDSPDQAKRKAEYIRQRALAGAMWWESSGDICSSNNNDHRHDGSLISTVSTVRLLIFLFFSFFFPLALPCSALLCPALLHSCCASLVDIDIDICMIGRPYSLFFFVFLLPSFVSIGPFPE